MAEDVVRDPLRVRVAHEQHAASLARTLNGHAGLHAQREIGGCEVAVDGPVPTKTKKLLHWPGL
jgi:hypothetical protein